MTYSLYANATASGTPVSTSTVTLSGGSVPASAVTAPLTVGSYSYVAVYSGDGSYTGSTSAVEPFTVSPSSTTTVGALTTGTNGSLYGTSLTFTATVTANGGGVPTGSVEFYDGNTPLGAGSSLSGSGNSATSTFTISMLSVTGSPHEIKAEYTATSSFLGSNSSSLSQTVTAAPLTVTASNQTKTYGFGGTSASLGTSAFTSTGLQNGETIGSVTLTTNATRSTSGHYNSDADNSGNPGTITPSAATGGTFTPSNYSITYVKASTGLTVNAAALTVSATGVNRAYDGAADATVTLSDNRVAGDVLSDSYTTASFANKNVGNGKSVSVSGIAISGTDAGNYTFNTTASTTANITPAAPTLRSTPGPTSVTLDGTGAPTLTDTATLSGGYNETGTITFTLHDPNGNLVDTEYVTTVSGDGSYTTPVGYTLPTNVTVTGTYQWDASYSGDPYTNPASDLNDSAGQVTVSPARPTLTTTNAAIVSVIGGLGVQIASLPGGPTSSLGAELEMDLINASVAAAQGNVAGVNSALSSFDSTTLTAVTTSGSGVNLTTAATLLTAGTDLYYTVNKIPLAPAATQQAELADFERIATNIPGGLTGDNALVAAFTNIAQQGAVGNFAGLNSALATFDSTVRSELATPGSGVNLTNATAMLEASTALYYTVNGIPETPTVSVSDGGGTYDGSPFAATATVAGVVAGIDDSPAPSLEGVTPSLTYYLLDARGNKLSQLGGAPVDAGYYEVDASFAGSTDYTSASASTTFSITPKALTASIIGDPAKVYDGTTTATLTSSNFSLTGLVGSQSFTVTQTAGTYDSKDTDAATVTASLAASQFTAASGTLASDYTLPTTASGAGTITPAAITYQIGNDNQVFGYPANLAHDLGTTITTGVNGETLAITYSSTGDIASAPVGSHAITGTLANGTGLLSDYSPKLIGGTLTVTLLPGSAYILNTSASSALTVSGNAVVNLPGMLVVDSSAANAINASGNAQISAADGVLVAGGVSTRGNATVSTTGTPTTTSDPLAALPLPSVTGLTNYGAVKVAGNSSKTLSPGIYTSIQVSGNASATLASGTYILEGGGLSVSGNASLSGSGVLIFNAGSSYNGTTDGGTFGSISLGGNGAINLSGPTSGPYAGVVIFQSRGNSRALSLGGNGAAGITSTVYAPAANVGLSGHATVKGALVVSTLTVTGSAGAFQLTGGASSDYTASTSNWISNGILTVAAEDDTGNGIDPNEIADVSAAMSYLNSTLGSFGVYLSWAAPGSSADVTIHFATTTPEGGASDGVLGFTTATNDVYIVTAGWNFYTGSDPSAIGSDQYDFTTLATHELAHTVGLGESVDPSSVMYEYLAPGTVRRTFTDSNLSLINTNADRFMKAALPAVSGSPGSLNLDSAWSTPLVAQVSSPLAVAAPGLAPGALPALGMHPAGSFDWESALTGSSVFSQVGPVATTPGLDGDDRILVSGSGNDLVSGGQGWNLMTAVFGLEPVAEESDEHGALDQLFASGELDLLLQSAAPSLDSALVGGSGNDLIIGSSGRNLMLGGFGIDQVAQDRAADSADAPATSGEQGA